MANNRTQHSVNTDLHQDLQRLRGSNPYRLPKRVGKRRPVTFGDARQKIEASPTTELTSNVSNNEQEEFEKIVGKCLVDLAGK